jgi:hypothetical protein
VRPPGPLVAIIGAVLLEGVSRAQTPDRPPAPAAAKATAANAATLYRQAFAALPKLTDPERELLRPSVDAPPAAARAVRDLARLEADLQSAFGFCHQGVLARSS